MNWNYDNPSFLPTFNCSVDVIASAQPPSMGIRALNITTDVVIPPWSEQDIVVEIDHPITSDEDLLCLAEPSNAEAEVLMAHHVVDPRVKTQVVRVLNPSRHDMVSLSAGTQVGALGPKISYGLINKARVGRLDGEDEQKGRSFDVKRSPDDSDGDELASPWDTTSEDY